MENKQPIHRIEALEASHEEQKTTNASVQEQLAEFEIRMKRIEDELGIEAPFAVRDLMENNAALNIQSLTPDLTTPK